MAVNEFLVNRVAVLDNVVIGNAATTWSQGVIIPAGAIITGIKAVSPGAQTNLTDASATIRLRVGTDPICSAITIKQLSAQTIPAALTMNNAGGVYVPNTGELNLIVQASSNSSYNGTVKFFVEYYHQA